MNLLPAHKTNHGKQMCNGHELVAKMLVLFPNAQPKNTNAFAKTLSLVAKAQHGANTSVVFLAVTFVSHKLVHDNLANIARMMSKMTIPMSCVHGPRPQAKNTKPFEGGPVLIASSRVAWRLFPRSHSRLSVIHDIFAGELVPGSICADLSFCQSVGFANPLKSARVSSWQHTNTCVLWKAPLQTQQVVHLCCHFFVE